MSTLMCACAKRTIIQNRGKTTTNVTQTNQQTKASSILSTLRSDSREQNACHTLAHVGGNARDLERIAAVDGETAEGATRLRISVVLRQVVRRLRKVEQQGRPHTLEELRAPGWRRGVVGNGVVEQRACCKYSRKC